MPKDVYKKKPQSKRETNLGRKKKIVNKNLSMRGRTLKGTEPKTPKESLNTNMIQKYLTKESSPKSPGSEKQQQAKGERRNTGTI